MTRIVRISMRVRLCRGGEDMGVEEAEQSV